MTTDFNENSTNLIFWSVSKLTILHTQSTLLHVTHVTTHVADLPYLLHINYYWAIVTYHSGTTVLKGHGNNIYKS